MVNSFKLVLVLSTGVTLSSNFWGSLTPTFILSSGYFSGYNTVYIKEVLFDSVMSLHANNFLNLRSSFSSVLVSDLTVLSESASFLTGFFDLSLTVLKFLIFFFVIHLFISNYQLGYNVSSSFLRLFVMLRSYIFMNLTFLTFFEVFFIFVFFFMSLYFLEAHFFFIFFSTLSTDTFTYQFNFLLSGFFLVFLVKLWRTIYTQSSVFSVSSANLLSLFYASSSQVSQIEKKFSRSSSISPKFQWSALVYAPLVFSLFLHIFFFVSTFIVWFLRFCIQFVRLLVLFIIHTVFEFVIVASDSYVSFTNASSFFIFKSIFLFFFYFCGFLYLIIYLNLMFTLQVFIFYFFSEVFQSNAFLDLSTTVHSALNLKK